MAGNIVGILFDGLAYGSLLFLVGVGLSITMGLMNFINLAHGAFAMIGGYASVYLANRAGIPFLATLPLAFVAAGLCGIIAERLLFQRLYKAPHLDQMLFTVGFVFSSIAAAHYFFGASQQFVAMPDMLQGQVRFMGVDFGKYRLLLIAFVAAVTLALHLMLSKTRFGAEIRAAVDNQDAAAGLGINVNLVFALCFALGHRSCRSRRRAGRGSARARSDLPVEIHGLFPAGRGCRRRWFDQGTVDRGTAPWRL